MKLTSLGPVLAGYAHGAHRIPLVHHNGLRSGQYIVKLREALNKEGTRHSWPEMFIILEGKGKPTAHKKRSRIRANTVICMPGNAVHQVTAEEDVALYRDEVQQVF